MWFISVAAVTLPSKIMVLILSALVAHGEVGVVDSVVVPVVELPVDVLSVDSLVLLVVVAVLSAKAVVDDAVPR